MGNISVPIYYCSILFETRAGFDFEIHVTEIAIGVEPGQNSGCHSGLGGHFRQQRTLDHSQGQPTQNGLQGRNDQTRKSARRKSERPRAGRLHRTRRQAHRHRYHAQETTNYKTSGTGADGHSIYIYNEFHR